MPFPKAALSPSSAAFARHQRRLSPWGKLSLKQGIRIAEIPLNSPDPFCSIEKMTAAFKGKLIMHWDPTVPGCQFIKPGGTCSQRFSRIAMRLLSPRQGACALGAGSGAWTDRPRSALGRRLKLFPAESASPQPSRPGARFLKACEDLWVGGVRHQQRAEFEAGVAGFGIGSNIYKQGASAAAVARSAKEFITPWRAFQIMKVALVTGAGSGIGKASPPLHWQRQVIRGSRRTLEAVAKEIGQDSTSMATDVAESNPWPISLPGPRKSLGQLDVVFNNAGTGHQDHSQLSKT